MSSVQMLYKRKYARLNAVEKTAEAALEQQQGLITKRHFQDTGPSCKIEESVLCVRTITPAL